jgi:hypothetical protein
VLKWFNSAVADDVLYALSNSTRRKVLEQLSAGPATVTELAAPFDMKLPSFVQHLSVLEQSRQAPTKSTTCRVFAPWRRGRQSDGGWKLVFW